MRKLCFVIPSVTLLAGFLFMSSTTLATLEYSKKEKKGCPTCHDMAKGKQTKEKPNLNKTGDFYKENKTLQGAPAK